MFQKPKLGYCFLLLLGYGICISHLQFEGTINALEEHEYFSSLNAAVKAQESEHLIASFEQDFIQSRIVLLHRCDF